MVSTIKNVEDLESKILSADDKLVVLDFYATWCAPCKEMDPHLKNLVQMYKGQVVVMKINVEKFQDLSDYYKVRCMPTFVFVRNKKRISSFSGADPVLLNKRVKSYL